jgi:hypothetical protein
MVFQSLLPDPTKIKKEFWHKDKTDSCARSKAARYVDPVVAVKLVPADPSKGAEAYEVVHTSFQSTSSCNITSVNALNACKLSVRTKHRGKEKDGHKRTWGIEMNEARQLYLGSYFRIDTIDHLIKNCHMFYRSWKYWHSPMIHGFAMTVVVAYDMYKECCEGKLNQEWKVDKPMDFYTFREKLSKQMLCYCPEKRCYPGDENHRKSKQQNSCQRRKMQQKISSSSDEEGNSSAARTILKAKMSCEQLKTELLGKRGKVPRLCQDFESLQAHVESAYSVKNKQICEICGEICWSKCGICNVPIHCFTKHGKDKFKVCFIKYHDCKSFGLARLDYILMGRNVSEWRPASRIMESANKTHIDDLMKECDDDSHI